MAEGVFIYAIPIEKIISDKRVQNTRPAMLAALLLVSGPAFAGPATPRVARSAVRMETKADLEALAKECNPAIGYFDPLKLGEADFWCATCAPPRGKAQVLTWARLLARATHAGDRATRRRLASCASRRSSTAASQCVGARPTAPRRCLGDAPRRLTRAGAVGHQGRLRGLHCARQLHSLPLGTRGWRVHRHGPLAA